MTAFHYIPATETTWLTMTAGHELLMVDGSVDGERFDRLWSSINSGVPIQELLDELTRGGISKTPPFALVISEGDFAGPGSSLKLIVRGTPQVSVVTDDESTTVTGEGSSTWSERSFTGVRTFAVSIDGDRPSARGRGRELPVIQGVVWASRVIGGVALAEPTGSQAVPGPKATEPSAASEQKPTEKKSSPIRTRPVEETIAEAPGEMAEEAELAAENPPPEVLAVPEKSGYDYLFGETIVRTVEDAAVREAETSGPDAVSADPDGEGDHDGKTSIGLDRAARQAARKARAERAIGKPPVAGGGSSAMTLELSSGRTEVLDQPVLIGRAPSVSKVSGASLPRLVTITGPDQDISRNHVQVAMEGGTVVVTDLHSRNGTMIILPGRPPQQLRAGEPTPVIPGTVVDLGAGVTFTVRER